MQSDPRKGGEKGSEMEQRRKPVRGAGGGGTDVGSGEPSLSGDPGTSEGLHEAHCRDVLSWGKELEYLSASHLPQSQAWEDQGRGEVGCAGY